jgi:hypothetical protein
VQRECSMRKNTARDTSWQVDLRQFKQDFHFAVDRAEIK